MRPERRVEHWEPVDAAADRHPGYGPLDAELEALDRELQAAGAHARRALQARTQPTRYFTNEVRDRLLASFREKPTRR